MDIVIPYNDNITGYLASTPEEFATKIANVFSLSEEEYKNVQINARENVIGKFSESVFQESISNLLGPILQENNN
ncbi:unnamed protein product [Rhizophagus irregularis]|nr:unnamed protein product [Rhizophagus irregularis]